MAYISKIPCSSEGKEWWWYADKSLNLKTLEDLAQEFLTTLDKCPSKLKKKILNIKAGGSAGDIETQSGAPPQKRQKIEASSTMPAPAAPPVTSKSAIQPGPSTSHQHTDNTHNTAQSGYPLHKCASAPVIHDLPKPAPSIAREPILSQLKQEKDVLDSKPNTPEASRRTRPEATITPKEYLERKERERIAQAAVTAQSSKHTVEKIQHRTELTHDFSPKKSNSPHVPHSSRHKTPVEQNKHKMDKIEVKSEPHENDVGLSSNHHRSDDKKRHHQHSHRQSNQDARHHSGGEPSPHIQDSEKRPPIKLEIKTDSETKLSRKESHREHRSKEHKSRHSNSGSGHSHSKEHHHRKRHHRSQSSSQSNAEPIPPLKISRGELTQSYTPPAKVPSLKIKLPPKPTEGDLPNSHNGNGTGTSLNHMLSSPTNAAAAAKVLEQTNKKIQAIMDNIQKKKEKPPNPPLPPDAPLPPLPPS